MNVGANLDVVSAVVRYAVNAFYLPEVDANFDEVSISNVSTGLDIAGGVIVLTHMAISEVDTGLLVDGDANVTYRGSFNAINQKAIVACNWNEGCTVDASYTDWGTANGPHLSGGSMACGKVETLPWVHGSTTHDGDLLFIANCDNSQTPSQDLDVSVGYFQDRMSSRGIDCDNGFQDACDAMQTAMSCLGGAVNLAGSTSPFPLPQINSYGDVGSWSETVRDGASDYIRNQAIQAVLPSTASQIFGHVNSLVGLFTSMSSAYSQCAP